MTLQKRTSTLIPQHAFSPVNPVVSERVIRPYIKLGAAVFGAGGIGSLLPKIWDYLPGLMNYLGLKQALELATPLFLQAILYSVLGLIFIFAISTKLLDAQIVLLLSRALLLIGLLFIICGFVSIFPESLIIHKILLVFIVFFAIFRFFILGPTMRFYWRKKAYGDIFLETLVLFIFIYILWSPISNILLGGG
jgi:hypothetical protein